MVILQYLIVFLVGILVFTLQIYISKKWAVTLAILFVAGVGWYVWHNETYMIVQEDFDSIYSEEHTVDRLEITNMENEESFDVTDQDAMEEVLSILGPIKGKRVETLSNDEYEYRLRFRIEKPVDNGDTTQEYNSVYISDDYISNYEITEGEAHMELIRELEAEAKE
ncbi:hypothetical protein [Salimicrobium halophilum]|uniref:Uncharacterized protein n=1 Tax=Salimicrobium halophilum TaxID=86666 RepID=A0A1G8RAM5_9BACI|nr:hypothetical protein [Salimicrobium halophilum]SDJ13430.1 hypothetical protein SAMN04490247_0898 [Salimicrobium halophilum]